MGKEATLGLIIGSEQYYSYFAMETLWIDRGNDIRMLDQYAVKYFI